MTATFTRYFESLRLWQSDQSNTASRRIANFRIVVGFLYVGYCIVFVLPRANLAAWQVVSFYAYAGFAVVISLVHVKARYPYWLLAALVHWPVFVVYLLVNAAYSTFVAHDVLRGMFWALWMPIAYIAASVWFDARRGGFALLIAPWVALAGIYLFYYGVEAPLRPGLPEGDMVMTLLIAQAMLVNLIYMNVVFREHYANSLAESERVASVARAAAESRRSESELTQSRLQLERLSRNTTMSALAASIAHEINQPLAAIVMNGSAGLRWLDDAHFDLEEARSALKQLVQDGHRAGAVLASVRSLLRRREADLEQVSINAIIQETIALLDYEVRKRDVTILTRLDEKLPFIDGDPIRLQQVCINLLMNSMDAMENIGGRDHIILIKSQQREAGGVMVTVEDSGKGIDNAHLSRIFDTFFTTKADGIGMGLSICKTIVQAHGGDLRATSSDAGAKFTMTLNADDIAA